MAFSRLTELPIAGDQIAVAVSMGKVRGHVGIVFFDGERKVLHLRKNLVAGADSAAQCATEDFWIACAPDIPQSARKQFAGIIRAVAKEKLAIRFGLNLLAARGSFDGQGHYSAPPGSDGLTCASFVSEVFRAAALAIVDETTWPESLENLLWGERVRRHLEKNGATPDHIEAVRNGNIARRLHPFEVGAAADLPVNTWPVDYSRAHAGRNAVEETLFRLGGLRFFFDRLFLHARAERRRRELRALGLLPP